MSDQEPVQGSIPPAEPVAAPPPRMACPRCRGAFEGSPDACPHCGLTKAEAATLNSQATITPPLTPQTEAAPPPTPSTEPPSLAAPVSAEVDDSPKKSRRWLLALPLVVLLLAGGYWWMSQKETEKPAAEEDACAPFREELLALQSQDFPNSRELARAEGEVRGRAHDAGCESDELRSET